LKQEIIKSKKMIPLLAELKFDVVVVAKCSTEQLPYFQPKVTTQK
jgi:hypothetical protein